ncbi:MAG TPA: hypothetical protein VJL34_03670 [Anaerolineales bacterium]|nr:hypothetical protein [Anaerolineales bacterium]
MKRIPAFLSVLILLILSACELPMPGAEAPPATITETEASGVPVAPPTDAAPPSPLPTFTPTSPPPEAPPVGPQPTPYPAPVSPAAPIVQPVQPTATLPAPTATSTPLVTFDPRLAIGEPEYENPMRFPNYGEWTQAGRRNLPDNRNLRLRFKDGQLYVTGKRPEFSTWWFTYHTLSDAYIEMTFNSENCSGDDAYGIITRGSPHRAGVSYGYVAAFTCEGALWVFRLDDADPWEIENLVVLEDVSAINAGPDEENVIGVRQEGERLVIYANGVQVAEVEDDHFSKGRVGVYVRSARPGVYTYRVTNFAYWLLGEEE